MLYVYNANRNIVKCCFSKNKKKHQQLKIEKKYEKNFTNFFLFRIHEIIFYVILISGFQIRKKCLFFYSLYRAKNIVRLQYILTKLYSAQYYALVKQHIKYF